MKAVTKEVKKSMTDPLVSVIIPAYRCRETICQAIDSALCQEFDGTLEVIVIDDRSPDDLQDVLLKYREDPRVRVLVNEVNSGAAASRNRGVCEARGYYVAFLDSDDWWTQGKLAAQIRVMRREKVVLCCTGRELMNQDGSPRNHRIPVRREITYRSLLMGNCINCSSVLMRKKVAEEFPMGHDDAHEDYIMWLQILRKYGRAIGIAEPYLKYRVVEGSKSGSKWKSARMTFRVYRYMGYPMPVSALFFCGYACQGVWKHIFRRGRS